jgi:predicted nucleic acid-binding protein
VPRRGHSQASERLTNDAVIAMSAASHGFTVQTKNPGDFQLIAEFRPFDWEVV